MLTYEYDIFLVVAPGTDAIWIDSVEGLEPASDRMRTLAAQTPGRYYLLCRRTEKILNFIDTSTAV